jgi:hypothetical protein
MYGADMAALAVVIHPLDAFDRLAEQPRLRDGLLVVLASGIVSMGLGIASNAIAGGRASGVPVSLGLPVLFVVYWLMQGWLVDAGAGMLGKRGKVREILAVSGWIFIPWIGYALLSLAEAGALRWGGPGNALVEVLAWCTLPILGWFLTLNVLAIRAVYGIPALNALSLALLPYAVLAAAVLVLLLLFAGFRAA